MGDENGIEQVVVGDLNDVIEQKFVIPNTKHVKFMVRKATNKANKDNTWRGINLQLSIVDGIDEEGKYKGKVLFSMITYYADPTIYTKDFFKTKQHLVPLKYLLKATGLDPIIDDEFLNKLEGTFLYGDIVQKAGFEGTIENDVKNFKAVPVDELV